MRGAAGWYYGFVLNDEVSFGVLVFTSRYEGQSPGEVLARGVATARCAEDAGFDDVWVTEHHFVSFGVNPSALTFAGYLLGRTERVQVGTAVTVLPLHSPVHVAEQAMLLDHVSGGRFELGVGRAQPVVDYEAIGPGVRYWQHGLPEALDVTLAALRGPVSGTGQLYRFREVTPQPGPSGARPVPVMLAVNSSASVELAAERGLPVLFFFDKSPEAKAELLAEHARRAEAAGHPRSGYRHGMALFAQVTEGDDEARAILRRAGAEFVRAGREYQPLLDVPQRIDPAVPPEKLIDGITETMLASHLVGTPRQCVDRLVHQIRVSGCRRVLCQVEASGDQDTVLANVERLGNEVLPRVRAALA